MKLVNSMVKIISDTNNFFIGCSLNINFMAATSASFASTKETTNYARLCRLLMDVVCQVLRSTFDKIHPPATLHTVLGSTSVHYTTLQSLYKGKKKKVLNPTRYFLMCGIPRNVRFSALATSRI